VGNLAFNLSNPLLVNTLGNDKFRDRAGAGAIIYSYLSVVTSIITALSFLTYTSVMEYETLKRKAVVRFGYVCATGLVCFGFCFPGGGDIYLASLLSVCCKVTQSIASLANDALLGEFSPDGNEQLLKINTFSHQLTPTYPQPFYE
jgi:MFS-type transporter involved in bile tolerance (Atg22 family)